MCTEGVLSMRGSYSCSTQNHVIYLWIRMHTHVFVFQKGHEGHNIKLFSSLIIKSLQQWIRQIDFLSMKCQWTYCPTLLPWTFHFHTLRKAPKTWKNHGIKKNQPGKILDFVGDLNHCEIKFSCDARTFQVSCTCLCTFYCCTLFFPKFISIIHVHPVINQYMY